MIPYQVPCPDKTYKELLLPDSIYDLIAGENCQPDRIGMSGASILICGDKVLKIQEANEESENEFRIMQYLQGKLPVPTVYSHETENGKSYLLMSKCSGQMACSQEYMTNPALQSKLLANGLKMLWNMDISDCPSDQRLPRKLAQAKYNVDNNLVDLDNVEPATFGENGFKDPAELLQWLYDHMPEEEPVLSHGDFCLPNILGIQDKVTGFIDLGKTGIADKWCDLAICYRSISHNFNGKYHGDSYPDYNEMRLFQELGIEPDWEKLRYYFLLDELF